MKYWPMVALSFVAGVFFAGVLVVGAMADKAPERPRPGSDDKPVERKVAEKKMAWSLKEAKNYFDSMTMNSTQHAPPRFRLELSKQLPSEWKIAVDEVEKDEVTGRLTAKLTLQKPEGEAAQVLTDVKTIVSLGQLAAGKHVLEVMLKADKGEYERVAVYFLDGDGTEK